MTPSDPPAMLNRRPPDFAAAGFGKDSVSVPGAAIRTVKRGVEIAREAVPTEEELRAKLRSRLSQEREARQAEVAQRRRTELDRAQTAREAEPEPFTRPADAINRSVGADEARSGASVEINGDITRYRLYEQETAAPDFDVRA